MERNNKIQYPADWIKRHEQGSKISVVTAYDAPFARLIADSEVDAILIGDTLGMVVQGHDSTLPVTVDDIIYHSRIVRRGSGGKIFLIGDLPFGSYQSSIEEGLRNAIRLMKEGGVQAIKLEGANEDTLEIIKRLTRAGVPVMGHTGLTPQSYLNMGGFRVRGRDMAEADRIRQSVSLLQEAGCFSVVLELIPEGLARQITEESAIPTIGIGSGVSTSGQVLVLQDMMGMDPGFHPKHVKQYANLAEIVTQAMNRFHKEVQDRSFPGTENTFK